MTAAALSLSAVAAERDSRASTRERLDLAARYRLTGAELARWSYAAAMHATRRLPRVSDDERAALAQMVAARVVAAHGPMPERSDVGREYLRTIAARIVSEDGPAGREWRDLASDYATGSKRGDGDRAMIVPLPSEADDLAASDPLTREVAAASMRDGSPLPPVAEDARELADLAADRLSADLALTPREDRAVRVALLRAGMEARGGWDGARPLASIAAALGCSLVTAKRASADGAAILRERVPAGRLAEIVSEVAAAAALVTPRDPARPHVTGEAAAALAVVEAAKRDGYRLARVARNAGGSPTPYRLAPASLLPLAGRWTRVVSGVDPARAERAARAARMEAAALAWEAYRVTVTARAAEGHGWAVSTLARWS